MKVFAYDLTLIDNFLYWGKVSARKVLELEGWILSKDLLLEEKRILENKGYIETNDEEIHEQFIDLALTEYWKI